MPEGIEAEIYRRAAASTVGRVVESVTVDELQEQSVEIGRELVGREVTGVRRRGKLVLVDFDEDLVLGLHFGMTGRLVIDGEAPIAELEYSSKRDKPEWDRLVLGFADGSGPLRINDPRRWAKFTLDPDESRLGPDLFEVTADHLAERLGRRRVALKGALLDQSLVAGLGNMIVDEVLWHAEFDPRRPANSLSESEVERFVEVMNDRVAAMLEAGGSHRGVLSPDVRSDQPPCPHPRCDGRAVELRREQVGGRTTIWCAQHQR